MKKGNKERGLLRFDARLCVLAVAHHPKLLADLAPQHHLPVPHHHVLLKGREIFTLRKSRDDYAT